MTVINGNRMLSEHDVLENSYSLFFSSRFLIWDGQKYKETIIDGKTLRFDGKLFFTQKLFDNIYHVQHLKIFFPGFLQFINMKMF